MGIEFAQQSYCHRAYASVYAHTPLPHRCQCEAAAGVYGGIAEVRMGAQGGLCVNGLLGRDRQRRPEQPLNTLAAMGLEYRATPIQNFTRA